MKGPLPYFGDRLFKGAFSMPLRNPRLNGFPLLYQNVVETVVILDQIKSIRGFRQFLCDDVVTQMTFVEFEVKILTGTKLGVRHNEVVTSLPNHDPNGPTARLKDIFFDPPLP